MLKTVLRRPPTQDRTPLQRVSEAESATPQRRFVISIRFPDRETLTYERTGGSLFDHVSDALDVAQLGSSVRVRCLREAQ